MRKNYLMAFVLVLSLGCIAFGEDFDIRKSSEKAFNQLADNSIKALTEVVQNQEKGLKNENQSKLKIAPVETPVQTTTMTTTTKPDGQTTTNTTKVNSLIDSKIAIKVWFELVDGTLVNPLKKTWKPKERFHVHIKSAVPIYVSLHQNYIGEDNKANNSVQVYPSDKHPESTKVIQANQEVKLPVLFELDDNKLDENMSMVVVRADWQGIQNGLDTAAVNSVKKPEKVNDDSRTISSSRANNHRISGASSSNSSASSNTSVALNTSSTERKVPQVVARLTHRGYGTLKCINDSVLAKAELSENKVEETLKIDNSKEAASIARSVNSEAAQAKFCIVGAEVSNSNKSEEVCFYMFANAHFGQWQLTIKK